MTADGWTVAGPPDREPDVPEVVASLAGGAPVRCVWANELGGLTFELVGAGRFVKWAPPGMDLGLLGEAERMRWARSYTLVPEVIDAGVTDDGAAWLLTAALPGETAVSGRWKADPRTAVRAIGAGLRALHDALPAAACPFTWSAGERVERARARARAGRIDPSGWHPSHRRLTVEQALERVAEPPPVDRLVVCHGDACAPNTLIDDDGCWSGHVDLGQLGLADRWADLAVATWSTEWNYGAGWEDDLLEAYGVAADPARIAYYRMLWDLGE